MKSKKQYVGWLKEKKIGANEPGASLATHEDSPDYSVDLDEHSES